MNNPNPEAFKRYLDMIREHSKILSFRDRKYMQSIWEQLKKKPIEDFSRSQYNIVNGIFRRLQSKSNKM